MSVEILSQKQPCPFSVESLLSKSPIKRKHPTYSKDFRKLKRKQHTIITAKQGYADVKDDWFGHVRVSLENKVLWDVFKEVGTEMVITKSGRRMFPALRFVVSGLNPTKSYVISVEIAAADSFHYKYHESEWCVTGKAFPDCTRNRRISIHQDSPTNGAQWTSNIISFHKLKITNNINGPAKHVVLNSLQKYQPRFHITECNDIDDAMLEKQPTLTFVFPETSFIAVTAYQSEQMTQLKIDNNPFAKGFRDPNPAEIERSRVFNPEFFNMLLSNNYNPITSVPQKYSIYKPQPLYNYPTLQPYQQTTSNKSMLPMHACKHLPMETYYCCCSTCMWDRKCDNRKLL